MKNEEMSKEEMEYKLIEIAFKYSLYEKPAPKKYDDVFLTDFENLLV